MSIKFFQTHQGQSTLEILGITVLVILGVIVGGPHLVRSINANFKSLEEGAIDSHREVLTQNQNTPTVDNLMNCQCTELSGDLCGTGSPCTQTQRVYKRTCSPLGCEANLAQRGLAITMSECREDPGCCEAPVATGRCGILANNAPGGRCPDGQMLMSKLCGQTNGPPQVQYFCQNDPVCVFKCGTGAVGAAPPDVNSSACPNTMADLISSANWTYIFQGACNANNKCEATCINQTIPINNVCTPTCGNATCNDGISGNPNYNENCSNCYQDCNIFRNPAVNGFAVYGREQKQTYINAYFQKSDCDLNNTTITRITNITGGDCDSPNSDSTGTVTGFNGSGVGANIRLCQSYAWFIAPPPGHKFPVLRARGSHNGNDWCSQYDFDFPSMGGLYTYENRSCAFTVFGNEWP